MTPELRARGWDVNHKRVERLMRLHGIVGVHKRAKVRTTIPAEDVPPLPDLVSRLFDPGAPDVAWVGDIEPRGAFEPCCGERTQLLVRRSGLVEVEGSLIPGTRVRVASSPDKAGTGQHCQMASGPANETGRCNDSESAYERLSRADHQLEPDGSGLGCGAHLCERGTPLAG